VRLWEEQQDLSELIPYEVGTLDDPQVDLPRIAKDERTMAAIEAAIKSVPTWHTLHCGDSCKTTFLKPNSIHLVLTSPPYWTLKQYPSEDGQLGEISDYELFLKKLDVIWNICYDALIPGGRLICVVGDVCLSRRQNSGRHTVVPLHASIQEHCRKIGFDNLAPIIWHKIANASYEVDNGGGFLGKPYEPNAIIKNDIEFILMERKPGGYRRPTLEHRIFSLISDQNHKKWFQQIWSGLTGASTREHPAPYPLELAERLIRMFSFVGDVVFDPFMGTGTTNLAAARWGRNSFGIEINKPYFDMAYNRINSYKSELFSKVNIEII
jgi:DNA modification methylase